MLIGAIGAAQLWLASLPVPSAPTTVAQAPIDAQAQLARDTESHRIRVRKAVRQRDAARTEKAGVARTYDRQLGEIDRLKRRRPSWRRDRQIRNQMSASHGTAKKLAAIDKRLRRLNARVRTQQRALLGAIKRELRGSPSRARKQVLVRWRRTLSRGLRRGAKKIVLPDDSIDPLADPEDLEEQAALLKQGEDQLLRELSKLDKQASRYDRMVALHKKRRRAAELGGFDDDRPRRSTGRGGFNRSSGGNPDIASEGASPTPAEDAPPSTPPPPDPQQTPGSDNSDSDGPLSNDGGLSSDGDMFDVVLADVVDASTVNALRRADMSRDPAVKARATKAARKQVKRRLERLKKRRRQMQQRARKLRRDDRF